MTGTLNRCSPCVRFVYYGYGGSFADYGFPVNPPPDTSKNWKYTDLNCGRVYMWSVRNNSWTC
jgi:hypothetical protein